MNIGEVMGGTRKWSHMLSGFGALLELIGLGFVALCIAWLGDPLRDENSRANTERAASKKPN